MRDLLNLLDSVLLAEATLAANEIPKNKASAVKDPKSGKPLSRPELFLHKVVNGSPFTLVKGGEVTIDPDEAQKVATWIQSGPKGVITLNTTDGAQVKNTDLQKTVEFGSKESETIKLKGSDIFNVTDREIQDFGNNIEEVMHAGGFPAKDMYEVIANSPQVKSLGELGEVVTNMAQQIASGQVPTIPKGLSPAAVKAIELYASEYLGVMGLVYGTTPFKGGSRKEFDKFVGTDINDMIVYFPKNSANPLADSFSIVNQDDGHAIKISSKAAGKGAAPAMSSVKVPPEVQEKYPQAYEFYKVVTNPGLSTFVQPFDVLNWFYFNVPDVVPKEYKPLMPFSPEVVEACMDSLKTGEELPSKIQRVFYSRLGSAVRDSDKATDGGKAWYAVTRDVIDAMNKQNAIPDFQPMIIESLGFNFIQLYSNVKGDKLVSEAFWPGKVNGQVILKTKGSSTSPNQGKLSIEISSGKTVDESSDRPKRDNIDIYGRKFQH